MESDSRAGTPRLSLRMTLGISHFAIKVHDLAGAERFYCGVLGLEVERRWPNPQDGGFRSLWLKTGDRDGTFLALEVVAANPTTLPVPRPAPPPDSSQREAAGHHLLALRISPDQRAHFESRLRAAGSAITHRTGFTIYFNDPEGNRLALSHYPDPAPDPVGA